ncbi:NAD(P)-dependent oxidoreductase [Psychroflexus maritimus]|uniref:Saccharopine dehydrogenase [NAD(+), L-lysine-forming] n=1 Tax=Psychroflexus maritimus TaxID=2714865 RepID=A0A967DXN3_9FLAO|nr:NAD(P)-dependent oxidoreductase [Psychroflexus maritimus]NGZ88865.1 alanine dehydrogenase [Psychroflexus maritimus]
MKFGIIKERKNPPDRRVVFSPEKLHQLQKKYPQFNFVVEPSNIRIFNDASYQEKDILITKNMEDCDVLLGVKEVPIPNLIPQKKYFFFSHTIKKQPYNRNLLRSILEKKIELFDHEVITKNNGARLIGFGRYAGLVGAYNGFRLLGIKNNSFQLSKAESLPDLKAMKKELTKVKLPKDLKICLTGLGKVAQGAKEILDSLNIKQVTPGNYAQQFFAEAVYTQIDVMDYNRRKDGQPGNKKEFFKDPSPYVSKFMKFARETDYFIAGHFYGDGAPYLFTREDAKKPDFRIRLVADISCDIDGPVASTIRPSTIANPFYAYHPKTEKEVDLNTPNSISVMAVDNLPCELPKDASEGFGEMFAKHVITAFANQDKEGILARAKMTENGKLTPRYSYLQDFVDGKE